MRKQIPLFFVLLSFFTAFSQESEYGDLSFNKAVNISGKQRMLTQRMGKIYLYLLDNPDDFQAKKDLRITKIIFGKQISILEKNTSSRKTKNKLKEVKSIWTKYKDFLQLPANKENAVRIINTNTTILKHANNVVNSIIIESQGGFTSKDTYAIEEEVKLEKVFTELDEALNYLLISNFNDERVDEALGDVSAIWEEVILKKERLFKEGYGDFEMYQLSNQLTKAFNKVTNLYEKVEIE